MISLPEFILAWSWFEPGSRLDWFGAGPGSANKTGALIALIMISLIGVGFLFKRNRFLWACVLGLPWLWPLLLTQSRGAWVAVAAGLLVLGFHERRLMRWRHAVLVIAVAFFVGFVAWSGIAPRLFSGLEDASIQTRLKLWSSVPAMMYDAPGGWGQGNAGEAYSQWYETEEVPVEFLSLINSHFTWWVESGLWGQLLYLAGVLLLSVILCSSGVPGKDALRRVA